VSDALGRWATERAPAILARAEAEAVAALRDALVSAALGGERGAATPAAARSAPAPAAAPAESAAPPSTEAGELLWAYCVLSADHPSPEDVDRVEAAGLAALVRSVPRSEYGEEPLRRNLNDLAWLEQVARSHEAVLEQALATSTIVPLRLCTLYENEQSVRAMLERERDSLRGALELLAGREEWGVKVLVETERLSEAARAESGEPSLEGVGDGGAYMLRRRHERETRDLADALARQVADEIHARLADLAIDCVTRPPQNRELSGHEGEMILNAAYLVDSQRVGDLRATAAQLESEHADVGARVELTGPWPPYNFVPAGTAAIG
jgi:Gas vesicle synthesis protein GvpL/GvpF